MPGTTRSDSGHSDQRLEESTAVARAGGWGGETWASEGGIDPATSAPSTQSPHGEQHASAAGGEGDIGLSQRRRQAWGESMISGEVAGGGPGGRDARPTEPEVVHVKLDWAGAAQAQAPAGAVQEQTGSEARWAVARNACPQGADQEEEDAEDEEREGAEGEDQGVEQGGEDLAVGKEGGDDVDSMELASARDTARQVLARGGAHDEGGGMNGRLEGKAERKEQISADPDSEPLPAVSLASRAPRAIYNKDEISSEESDDE